MILFVDIIICIVRQRIEYTFCKNVAPLTLNLPRFWKRFITQAKSKIQYTYVISCISKNRLDLL
jgi:hypothetical protein